MDNELTGQLRFSILNSPDGMSALAFKSWFRSEALSIQRLATRETDFTIIRLFVPERVRMKWTGKEWDRLCQDVVERHANIYRVEVRVVKDPLDVAQMMEAQAEAQADLRAMAQEIQREQRIDEAKDVFQEMGQLHVFINENRNQDLHLRSFPCASCGSIVVPTSTELQNVPVKHVLQFGICTKCGTKHIVASAGNKVDCIRLEPVVAHMKELIGAKLAS